MPLSLSGTLTDPYGSPRSDAAITFRAITTSNQVLEHANASAITDTDGEYAITVEFGRYNIEVKESGSPSPRIIAKNVLINSDTTAADLNELVVAANGYDDLTPQIVVEFRALRNETQGYRDEAQAAAKSANEDATATADDRQEVDDDRTHIDQQRQAVDSKADEVEADRLAAQQARTGSEDARDAGQTARDESRAWATGDGVIDNISGTDRFSARVEADRAADERQGAEDASSSASDSATLAGQRATTAGEHETAAGDSATESENWATYPIDTPVPEGDGEQYSSRHWAEISRQRAVSAMVAQGAWDASTGALPAEPAGASYWLVTGAPNGVTVDGVEYRNKDMLLWTPGETSEAPGQWSKIDNTDSVVSVAGKSGAVELVPSDVGADPAGTATQTMSDHVAEADPHTQYVQKVTGKALSTNDYTDPEKSKLAGVESGATQNATNAQLRDRSTHTGTQTLSTLSDAGTAAAANTGTGDNQLPTTSEIRSTFEIYAPDPERRAVEAATGGSCTIERTANGQSCYMFVIPRLTWDDLVPSGELGTGTHEAFIENGVERSELLYGMFMAAEVNGELVSQPRATGRRSIDWDQSMSMAQAAGLSLASNWEWSAISFWCMANGFQPRGNTDYGRSHSNTYERGVYDDDSVSNEYTLLGSGPNTWNHNDAANGIADLVGSRWEWQWGFKMVDGRILLAPDNDKSMSESAWVDSGYDLPSDANPWSSLTQTGATQQVQRALIVPNGVSDPDGRLYANLSGERFPGRGGRRGDAGNAGLAALNLIAGRTYSHSGLGLRLSRLV